MAGAAAGRRCRQPAALASGRSARCWPPSLTRRSSASRTGSPTISPRRRVAGTGRADPVRARRRRRRGARAALRCSVHRRASRGSVTGSCPQHRAVASRPAPCGCSRAGRRFARRGPAGAHVRAGQRRLAAGRGAVRVHPRRPDARAPAVQGRAPRHRALQPVAGRLRTYVCNPSARRANMCSCAGHHESSRRTTSAAWRPGDTVVRRFDAPEALDMRFHEVRTKSALNRVPAASRVPFQLDGQPLPGLLACVCVLPGGGHAHPARRRGGVRPLADLRVGRPHLRHPQGSLRRHRECSAHWADPQAGLSRHARGRDEDPRQRRSRFLSRHGWGYVATEDGVSAGRPAAERLGRVGQTLSRRLLAAAGGGAFAPAPRGSRKPMTSPSSPQRGGSPAPARQRPVPSRAIGTGGNSRPRPPRRAAAGG